MPPHPKQMMETLTPILQLPTRQLQDYMPEARTYYCTNMVYQMKVEGVWA